jgi:hypothetical protein
MIDPATSWFEIVKLPTVAQEMTVPPAGKGKKVTFDKNTKAGPCSLPKLFVRFFFIVCRYCTRRQSHGNFCLRLAMQVYVDVFVGD